MQEPNILILKCIIMMARSLTKKKNKNEGVIKISQYPWGKRTHEDLIM